MSRCTLHRYRWQISLVSATFFSTTLAQEAAKYLEQSFFFDWNPPGQPVPIPITPQCDALSLTWERGSATGPSPVAPYILQVYTSTFVFPFVVPVGEGLSFDWNVPFAPGTQYQICMFDKNGNTGGCQSTYTVIPPVVQDEAPSCPNVTFPQGPLDVEAMVHDGPMSQFGWIDQCTDIQVTPKNGTPPYTFTIAPSLHPPWNITIDNVEVSANWTVALSWASPFYISVSDSLGNSWAQGPLHSGGGGPTRCLALETKSFKKPSPSLIVGTGVGSLCVGILLGIGSALLFMRYRRARTAERGVHQVHPYTDIGGTHDNLGRYQSLSTQGGEPTSPSFMTRRQVESLPYPTEPFAMQTVQTSHLQPQRMTSTSFVASPASPVAATGNSFTSGPQGGQQQQGISQNLPPSSQTASTNPAELDSSTRPQQSVYVIHHDAGGAPITVFHDEGTQVVELPPRYIPDSEPTPRASEPQTTTPATIGTLLSPPGQHRSLGSNSPTGQQNPSSARSDRASSLGTDYSNASGLGNLSVISNPGPGDGLGAAHLFMNQPRQPGAISKPGGVQRDSSRQIQQQQQHLNQSPVQSPTEQLHPTTFGAGRSQPQISAQQQQQQPHQRFAPQRPPGHARIESNFTSGAPF